MSPIINAAPRAILHGVQDKSVAPPVIEQEQLPTHLPHLFIYAEKGPTLPQLVSGDAMISLYGRKTFDTRSKYYNHQTLFATLMNGNANQLMVQRIVPTDAGPKARLLLSLDIVEDDVPTYRRDGSGYYELDDSGLKKPTSSTTPGYKARWVLNDWTKDTHSADAFGECQVQAGSITSTRNSTQSKLYPIMEFEVNFQGEYGNHLGLVLEAPTARSSAPTNPAVYLDLQAFVYRLRLVERADARSTANTVKTMQGEDAFEFVLKPEAIDPVTEAPLSLTDIVIGKYQQLNQRGFPPQYGPFGRVKVYTEHLVELMGKVAETENSFNVLPAGTNKDSDSLYAVNLFTAQNWDGVPYHSLLLDGPIEGGLRFSKDNVLFAAGGSDGTMSDAAFSKAVKNQLENYGDLEAPVLDDARYPQSCIYDSGFDMDTKKAMYTVLGRRKDMAVIMSTQDVNQPMNTPAQDSSIAIALRTAARNYPESEVYGTPVCRAMVVGNAGYLLDHPWKRLVPFTYELANKFSKYMGAGNGEWRTEYAFDVAPNNQITLLGETNIAYKKPSVRSQDWSNGLVWAQSYDRGSSFFPAYQTVYDEDRSTLNSARTMWAIVELQKIAQRNWRRYTGNTKLTQAQFIEQCNMDIRDQARGRFDDSIRVVPHTEFTQLDKARGYSWTCKIHMYSNHMVNVGAFTIVAHGMNDFQQNG